MPTISENVPCWWCGAPADSGEHKFKRSDLVKAFGGGAWRGPTAVAHVTDRVLSPQSSGASRFKFAKLLCHACNTARSQPFDRSYDALAEHIRDHGDQVLSTDTLDWTDVYGEDWQNGVAQLTRYWVKHVCCRLVEVGALIHPDLLAFLNGAEDMMHLRMGFEIRDDIVEFMLHLRDVHGESQRSLWLGPAAGVTDTTRNAVVQVSSHTGIDWLRLWYDYDYDDPEGSVDFSTPQVVIPRDFSIDPAEVASSCRVCNPELGAYRGSR